MFLWSRFFQHLLKVKNSRSFCFIAFDLISKGMPFLAIPVISHGLGAELYGNFSLFITHVSLLTVLFGFYAHNAFSSVYYNNKRNWRVVLVETLLFWTVAFLVVFLGLVLFRLIYNFDELFILILIAGYASWLFQMLTAFLQVNDRLFLFGFFQVLRSLLLVVAQVYPFFFLDDSDFKFVLYLYVFSCSVVGFFSLFYIFLSFDLRREFCILLTARHFSEIKWSLDFGFPLVINGLSGWVRVGFDRYLIQYALGAAYLGFYSYAFQYASIVSVLGLSLARAANISSFKWMEANGGVDFHGFFRRLAFYFIAMAFVFVFVCSFFFVASEYFFVGDYRDGYVPFVFISLAFLFQGFSSMMMPFFQFQDNNGVVSRASLFAIFLTVVLSPLLCYNFGVYGVAVSFLLVWFSFFSCLLFFMKKTAS